MREDNDSNVLVMITRLIWTIWTPMTSVSPWMNDHCVIFFSHGYLDKLKGEWVKLSAFFGWFMHVVSGHSVCWRFGSRDPGFESCIQQRKTTILLPNRYHFPITSASKLVQTNMLVYWCMSTPRLTDSYPDQLLDSEWFLVKSSPGDGWMMFPHWFEGAGGEVYKYRQYILAQI